MKLDTQVVASLPQLGGTDRRRENFESEFLGQLDSAMPQPVVLGKLTKL